MRRWWSPAAARIVAVYVAFSLAWILVGDRLAQAAAPAQGVRLTIEDAKGTLFVVITGALVYVLVALHGIGTSWQVWAARGLAAVSVALSLWRMALAVEFTAPARD